MANKIDKKTRVVSLVYEESHEKVFYDSMLFMDAKNGKFTSGVKALGIAEGGVDWALDENNESLITADIKSAVEAAREAILSGSVTVHDYLTDQTCPY